MGIACSTAVCSKEPLDTALATIAGLGFEKIDLLTIDGWAHVNTRDLADDWDPTLERVDRLLCDHGLSPIALNTGVSPQLHDRSEEANARRTSEVDALIRLASHCGVSIAAIQPRNADPDRPWDAVLADCVVIATGDRSPDQLEGVWRVWYDEMSSYPVAPLSDTVMACWFAREGARAGAQPAAMVTSEEVDAERFKLVEEGLAQASDFEEEEYDYDTRPRRRAMLQ